MIWGQLRLLIIFLFAINGGFQIHWGFFILAVITIIVSIIVGFKEKYD